MVKLPNVSASIPQLEACIEELRSKGYDVPTYPHDPEDAEERDVQSRYAAVLGSAVNPVLREGNSDRRVAPPVKAYAAKNPHKMGIWSKASRTHVAHMDRGDFFSSELSATIGDADTDVVIELVQDGGAATVLKGSNPLQAGEVIDAATMSAAELVAYYEREIQDAADSEIMLSLHLKATMMKVSDPILFGHCVRVFFRDAFAKHGAVLDEIGANPNNGLGAVLDSIDAKLDAATAREVRADFEACYEGRPWLAMVNSDKGITNLHVPSDIIIDASMPVVVRDSGQMWNKDNELEDTKCLIPDRSYATMYQEVISYVKTKGQFDVATMGNVANVGLMAQKAEEYGSHDKTFEIQEKGVVRVTDKNTGEVYFEHPVEAGDIYRMCQTKDAPIKDWVRLAVERARATGDRAIFWLDKDRAHDASLIEKVNTYLQDHDLSGVDLSVMKPVDAIRVSMERATDGKNTISVTGNVLRDYLTDLFPILELGTSAKMLSIVPLLAGGGCTRQAPVARPPSMSSSSSRRATSDGTPSASTLPLPSRSRLSARPLGTRRRRCSENVWTRPSVAFWTTGRAHPAGLTRLTTAGRTSTLLCTGANIWPSKIQPLRLCLRNFRAQGPLSLRNSRTAREILSTWVATTCLMVRRQTPP